MYPVNPDFLQCKFGSLIIMVLVLIICDYWLSLNNETDSCYFMVSGAARSQLYDGVGVGLFVLHHLESYQDDGNVGACDCDQTSIANETFVCICYGGESWKTSPACGPFSVAGWGGASYFQFNFGASYCDYVWNRERSFTYGICGGCRGDDDVVGMFYLHKVYDTYVVPWIGAGL